MREVEGLVRRWSSEGAEVREIVRRLGFSKATRDYWLTFGDVTAGNMVRSILHGPTPRPEVVEALRAGTGPQGTAGGSPAAQSR